MPPCPSLPRTVLQPASYCFAAYGAYILLCNIELVVGWLGQATLGFGQAIVWAVSSGGVLPSLQRLGQPQRWLAAAALSDVASVIAWAVS